MRILITGASGFLGSFLCPALKREGHELFELHSRNCDLTRGDALRPWDRILLDQIYHLAAWTRAGDFCLKHPGKQWLINQKINTNLLHWWQERQPQARLITIGSSCAYDPALPLEETYYLKGSPIDSLLSYAMTKRMLLYGLEALHSEFGLHYLYVIPSTIYGPDYPIDGRQRHFIFDVIHKLLVYQMTGAPPVLWGDGEQRREVVHGRDLVDALLHLVSILSDSCVNIGPGEEHSIKSFVSRLCAYLELPFEVVQFDPQGYVGARSKKLAIQKLKTLYPSYSPLPLDQGLRETVDSYRSRFFYGQS